MSTISIYHIQGLDGNTVWQRSGQVVERKPFHSLLSDPVAARTEEKAYSLLRNGLISSTSLPAEPTNQSHPVLMDARSTSLSWADDHPATTIHAPPHAPSSAFPDPMEAITSSLSSLDLASDLKKRLFSQEIVAQYVLS